MRRGLLNFLVAAGVVAGTVSAGYAAPATFADLAEKVRGVAVRSVFVSLGQGVDLAVTSDSEGTYHYVTSGAPNALVCSLGTEELAGRAREQNLGVVHAIEAGETAHTLYILGEKLFKTTNACRTVSDVAIPSAELPLGKALAYGHGRLLVARGDGTLLISSDGGANFKAASIVASAQEIRDIVASPQAAVFFALVRTTTSQGVYRSIDGGENWSVIAEAAAISCLRCRRLAVNPASSLELLASGRDIVRLSADGGSAWSTVTPPQMREQSVGFAGSKMYVGSLESNNGGSTWTDLNDTSTRDAPLTGPILPAAEALSYMISRGGLSVFVPASNSWLQQVLFEVGSPFYSFDFPRLLEGGTAPLFLGGRDGVLKSAAFNEGDFGGTPTLLDPSTVSAPTYAVLFPDSEDPQTALVGSSGKIFRTADGGTTWSPAIVTSARFSASSVVTDFADAGSGTVFASFRDEELVAGGILKSVNFGATWSDLTMNSAPPVNTVVSRNGVVIAGVGSPYDATASLRGLYRYDGASWSEIGGVVDAVLVHDLASDAGGSVVLAASGDNGSGTVFRSRDFGVTWEALSGRGLANAEFRAVAVDPAQASRMFAIAADDDMHMKVFQSKNGGTSWTSLFTGLFGEIPLQTMYSDSLSLGGGEGLLLATNSNFSVLREISCKIVRNRKQGTISVRLVEGKAATMLTDVKRRNIRDIRFVLRSARVSLTRSSEGSAAQASFGAASPGIYRATCAYRDADKKRHTLQAKKIVIK